MPIPAGGLGSGDRLASPEDLAALLQQDLDAATAGVVLEAATAVVQAAAGGQRIGEVAGDTATLLGTTDSWLDLPQIPVTAITSVTLDGTAITAGVESTQYRRYGNRLFRYDGWQVYVGQPSPVVVVYTHGYPAGHQSLQLARSAVLSLSRGAYTNPSGATSEAIDDYRIQFERAAAEMAASPTLQAALRRQYGRRGGLVRIG